MPPEKLREVTGSHRNVSNVERDRRKCIKGILWLAIAGQSHITVAGAEKQIPRSVAGDTGREKTSSTFVYRDIRTGQRSATLWLGTQRERRITHLCSWDGGEVVLLALRNPGCGAGAGIPDMKTFRDQAIEQWGQWRLTAP